MDQRWERVEVYLKQVLEYLGADPIQAKELVVVPGLDELLALQRLGQHLDGCWDLIVVDCAPTSETVRLLALPATIDHYLTRILPSHRRLARRLLPMVRSTANLPPAAPDAFLDDLLALAAEISALNDVLTDPATTAVRLVATPEAIVLDETRRAWSLLTTFDHHVDALVLNRLMPAESGSALVDQIRGQQRVQMRRAAELFGPLHRYDVDLAPSGATGVRALRRLGLGLYGPAGSIEPGGPRTRDSASNGTAASTDGQLFLPVRGGRSRPRQGRPIPPLGPSDDGLVPAGDRPPRAVPSEAPDKSHVPG